MHNSCSLALAPARGYGVCVCLLADDSRKNPPRPAPLACSKEEKGRDTEGKKKQLTPSHRRATLQAHHASLPSVDRQLAVVHSALVASWAVDPPMQGSQLPSLQARKRTECV